jgi:hypothetical protein
VEISEETRPAVLDVAMSANGAEIRESDDACAEVLLTRA